MRYERLILTSGQHGVTVRFHPRFTVIAGVGPLERDGLTSDLLGPLAGSRPGTNLEIAEDSSRRLSVLRSAPGLNDRVLDAVSGADVTRRYAAPDGSINLLTPYGLTLEGARRLSRFGALDLLGDAGTNSLVHALASARQGELWPAADRLLAARATLEAAATAAGASLGDTEVIAEVDDSHREFEVAQRRCEKLRRQGIMMAIACALGGVPAVFVNRLAAVPFVVAASVFTALSILYRRRLEAARLGEDAALAAAGASSYNGFVMERVRCLIGNEETRRKAISTAVAEHHKAKAAWSVLAGDIDPLWAVEHRPAVIAASATAGDPEALRMAQALLRERQADPRELAELVSARLDALRTIGLNNESLPLILDEPFDGVDEISKRWLLELLVRSAGRPQIVLLTEDPDLIRWAEAEAVDGALSVVCPHPDTREISVAS